MSEWGVPKSTGPYPVASHDILNKPGLDSSMFRIYYPTKAFEPNDKICPAWMEPEQLNELSKYMGTFEKFTTPVLENGPLVMPGSILKLPVVLMSHGLMLAKNAYSFMCSDVASYGFIVAALDHRDESACASLYFEKDKSGNKEYIKKWLPFNAEWMGTPDTAESTKFRQQQVEKRVQDISKLVDCIEQLNDGKLENLLSSDCDLAQFKGKIDKEKIAIFGHSHGGATSIASSATEKRIKVAVPLDAWMITVEDKYYKMKIKKPMLFINCLGEVKKFDIIRMRLLDGDDTSAIRKMVTILGTTHLTQTDFGFFPNSWLEKLNFKADNDPMAMNKLNTKMILSFIKKHLGLSDAGDVDSIVGENPELVLDSDIKVEEEEIKAARDEIMK